MARSETSFYDLAFGVDPGGARKDCHYVRGTLDEIKRDLANALEDQLNLYLLCWYGAALDLRVFENGELTRAFDLHSLITIDIDGYPTITFDGQGEPVGYDFQDEDDDDGDSLTARMFGNELTSVTVTLDWSRIDVPPLRGKVVQNGDFVNIDGDWLDDDDKLDAQELLDRGYLPYGCTDRDA